MSACIPARSSPIPRHPISTITDAQAKDRAGHWHVVSVYPVIYYPQAKERTA
jgi:hypothetical protein